MHRPPNMRVQRTRSLSSLHVAIALTMLACRSSAPLREPETWQIDIRNDANEPLGRVVVELTGHRAHGAADSPDRWVEIATIVTSPPGGLDGVGTEAEVRIADGQFNMNLNRGVMDGNLILTGALNGGGTRASGEAHLSGVIGLKVGRFLARRV